MISTDSLQVLENPMVQSTITSARGTGLLIGMIIGILVMTLALYIVTLVNKRNIQWLKKEHTLWKYRRMKMEMGWVDMIRICKECLEGDIRIVKPTTVLFREFPDYDEERRKIEVQHFPGVVQAYQGLIDDRSAVVNTLQTIIDRDTQYIKSDIDLIEQQYPEETSQYKNEIE